MIYVLNKIFCCDPFETIDLPTSYKLPLFFDLVGVDVHGDLVGHFHLVYILGPPEDDRGVVVADVAAQAVVHTTLASRRLVAVVQQHVVSNL